MNSNRPRLTRRTASRWLDHPRELSGDPLGALLSAAAAESPETDAAAEEIALAQFRAALAPAAPARTPRKLFTAPVVVAGAVGALFLGGVAVAATQGGLDSVDLPFDGHDNRSDHAPDAPSSTNPGHDRTRGPKPGKPTTGPGSTTGPSASESAPAPSLKGLCNAYQAGAFKPGTKSQAFQALVKAAGGVDQVAEFCVELIGPSTKPTQAAQPTKPPQAGQPGGPTKTPKASTTPTKTKAPSKGKTPTKGKPAKTPAEEQTSTS